MKAYTGPMRIAHRGVSQAAPENTLGAFQAAAELGLEGVELDIRLSRDGEVVVVHDSNLTRMTIGHPSKFTNGVVEELSWEELAQVELPYANHTLTVNPPRDAENEFMALLPNRQMGQEAGHSYAAELQREPRMAKLLRLSDFIAWLETAPGLLAEIEVNAAGATRAIFDILAASPARERCIVFSGNPLYIYEMQQYSAMHGKPDGVKLGANIRVLSDEIKEDLEDMDLYEVGLNAQLFSAQDVRWLADRGTKVFANLGDFPRWWAELCRLPLAGFKTNYAQAYTQWWHKEGPGSL